MTIKHIVAITLIFVLGAIGWTLLAAAAGGRSASADSTLSEAVRALWGMPLSQPAPRFSVRVPGSVGERSVQPSATGLKVALTLDQRRKGLLWYATYVVDFQGSYTLRNEELVAQTLRVDLPLPSATATYEGLRAQIGEQRVLARAAADGGMVLGELVTLAPGETRIVTLRYRTRGVDSWRYALGAAPGNVKTFVAEVGTNFRAVDYADGSLSPTEAKEVAEGLLLTWRANDLITRQDIAIELPRKINPGPLAARMSMFAPVCLLFFFVLVTAIGLLARIAVHPMHYLFITAGFFAFHLLFAYLVDVVNIHLAFVAATITSVGLVTAYLRAALGPRFPWRLAGLGQVVYLVLFSYSFFLTGMTGLIVTLGSIVTLAGLMRATAALDWAAVFAPARARAESA